MTPTCKLRFVRRYTMLCKNEDGSQIGSTEKVLQQWWEASLLEAAGIDKFGEWRDVPVEVDDDN